MESRSNFFKTTFILYLLIVSQHWLFQLFNIKKIIFYLVWVSRSFGATTKIYLKIICLGIDSNLVSIFLQFFFKTSEKSNFNYFICQFHLKSHYSSLKRWLIQVKRVSFKQLYVYSLYGYNMVRQMKITEKPHY